MHKALLSSVAAIAAILASVTAGGVPAAHADNPAPAVFYQQLVVRDAHTGAILSSTSKRTVVPNSIPPDGGAQGGNHILRCNEPFSDTLYGKFTYEWLCPQYQGGWSFKLLSSVTAGATSTISESGMAWSRNSKIGPQNAPHPAEGQGYLYHGTLNPNKLYDEIAMSDSWFWVAGRNTYTVNIGYTMDLQK